MGDDLLAALPTARAPLACAGQTHEVLRAQKAGAPEKRMDLRIGLPLGETPVEGERLFGGALPTAGGRGPDRARTRVRVRDSLGLRRGTPT